MLRVWEEVSKIFLDFLTQSKNSPYKNAKATFSRREYQSNSGNLAHSHIILAINWERLIIEEREFVENLARGSVFDVVHSDDITEFINNEYILSQKNVMILIDGATIFLTHKYNDRCLVKTSTGELRCRMPQYIHMTLDNTKQQFVDLLIHTSDEC